MKNGTRVPSFDVANNWRVSYWLASIGGVGASKGVRAFDAGSYENTVAGVSGALN